MNTALTVADVRPRVFDCSLQFGANQLHLALLWIRFLGLGLIPLLWLDGPMWPDRVMRVLVWNVSVCWLHRIPLIPGILDRLWPPGHIRVFSDCVVVGYGQSAPAISRTAIVSVERWTGPLFDNPWQAVTARSPMPWWGFATNTALGRFHHYVTCESNAVVIRSTTGTPLVVIPDDPDGFVEALRPGGGGSVAVSGDSQG